MTAPDRIPRRRGRPPSGGRQAILDAALAILREDGIAKVTSREVAGRAGVSDGSVYYHFGDRNGLLIAVLEYGIKPMRYLETVPVGSDWRAVLAAALTTLEAFFDDMLPVVFAAQSETDLSEVISAHFLENDLGPHRGVAYLGAYLRREQAAGRVHPDADVDAVALLVINTATSRAARRLAMCRDETDPRVPSLERQLASLRRLLEP